MDEVFYRLPETTAYHYLSGKAVKLDGIGDLQGRSGFVFAPFHADANSSIVLLSAVHPESAEVPTSAVSSAVAFSEESHREAYHEAFARLHGAIDDRDLGKVVLSRRADIEVASPVDAREVFFKACRLYPHQMIVLVSTELTGTWLMATPELLLERKDNCWATMALAGTMTTPGPWSDKNLREQYIVTTYIRERLLRRSYMVRQIPPRTVMAARLYHLQTDFEFHLNDDADIVKVLADLFPTPAVCGMTKQRALEAILSEEGLDRKYYSGFCGLWNLPVDKAAAGEPGNSDGSGNAGNTATALYVSLRCMEMDGMRLHLYAGGGLLDVSDEDTEWEETEKKLQTMKALL